MIAARVSYKDIDRSKELGTVITMMLNGPNEDDVSINVAESYDTVKALLQ